MPLKSVFFPLVKRFVPMRIRQSLHRANIWWEDGSRRHLGRGEVFDTIYRTRNWGGTDGQLSGFGSVGQHADAYVDFVRAFIAEHQIQSVLDVGCGDFHIGARICDAVPHYIAADVSQVIIAQNQARHGGLASVSFRQLDLCSDALPAADLITVREVFQHLSNTDIAMALANIERSGARHVLVTEHLPTPDILVAPNLDKPRGANIRHPFGSGVFLDLPPFSRPKRDVLTVDHPAFQTAPGYLVTSLWQPATAGRTG